MSTLDPMMPALRRSEYAQRVRACAQAHRLRVMAGDDSVRPPSPAQRLGDFLIAAGTRLKGGPQGASYQSAADSSDRKEIPMLHKCQLKRVGC